MGRLCLTWPVKQVVDGRCKQQRRPYEVPYVAGQQKDGHEAQDGRQGGGEQGAEQMPHRRGYRLHPRQAGAQPLAHLVGHDDGIVDEEPDGDDHPEDAHLVDLLAEQGEAEKGEGAGQGQGRPQQGAGFKGIAHEHPVGLLVQDLHQMRDGPVGSRYWVLTQAPAADGLQDISALEPAGALGEGSDGKPETRPRDPLAEGQAGQIAGA